MSDTEPPSPTDAPAGIQRQLLLAELIYRLRDYTEKTRSGIVMADGGFLVHRSPDTYRSFDVAYIAFTTLPTGEIPTPFWETIPDFVAKIVAPDSRASETRQLAADYIAAGVRLAWLIYPDALLVDVYQPGHATLTLELGQRFDGANVLPAFDLGVDVLFGPIVEK
jgi:Uma2 family endonuclease